ncbi:MAG: hypothetical protein AVDCRST_MAG75-2111 [uncultured Propionibacteriaceae bacterium]|uniref:Lipoprotein n=1 Tax=uncultured Propionibacteriaceae bacterium TaxID=257457 RepID=A0A6J4NXZ1_9ACTN|nr:MAG: hypothetical protein AVDCRST_MAG75-2111 [uncultured Propionibacteriaceae bacterium]
MIGMRTNTSWLAAALLLSGCGLGADAAGLGTGDVATESAGVVPANRSASPGTSAASPTPSTTPSASASSTPKASASPAKLELPRGGTSVFPRYRLVGYAGLTGSPPLGRLGIGRLGDRVDELEKRAESYAQGREALPVLEIIATIVQADAGADGKYRVRSSDADIRRYLKEARAHQALLLLNIQPGRAEFLEEVKAYDKWLAEPDVGVALDPEWAMDADQIPGGAFGHTTGAEIDSVAAHLSRIVAKHDLPEKVLVYHQLAPQIVRKESQLKKHKGVVLIKSVDGIGSQAAKINTYRQVNKTTPKFVHPGFKLFLEEDAREGRLMTPKQVLAIKPKPDYIMYE